MSLYNLTSTPNFPLIAPKALQTTFSVGLKSTLTLCYSHDLTWQLFIIHNKTNFKARSCQHLAQHPKLEDHSLSAVRDCLFSIFAAALHIAGRSSIRNLRMRHAVVTGTRS